MSKKRIIFGIVVIVAAVIVGFAINGNIGVQDVPNEEATVQPAPAPAAPAVKK